MFLILICLFFVRFSAAADPRFRGTTVFPGSLVVRNPVVGDLIPTSNDGPIFAPKVQGALLPTRPIYLVISEMVYDTVHSVAGDVLTPIHVAIHFGAGKDLKVVEEVQQYVRGIRFDLVRTNPDKEELGFRIFKIETDSATRDGLPNPEPEVRTSGAGSTNRVMQIGTMAAWEGERTINQWATKVSMNIARSVRNRKSTHPVTLSYDKLIRQLRLLPWFKNQMSPANLQYLQAALRRSAAWEDVKWTETGSKTPKDPFPKQPRVQSVTASIDSKSGSSSIQRVTWATDMGEEIASLPQEYALGPSPGRQKERWVVGQSLQYEGGARNAFNAREFLFPLAPTHVWYHHTIDGRVIPRPMYLPVYSTPELRLLIPELWDHCSVAKVSPRSLLQPRDACSSLDDSKVPKVSTVPTDAPAERVTVRTRGTLRIIETFNKIGDGATVVGLAAAPGFIIYDLAKGKFAGAGISSAGLAAELGVLVATRSLLFTGLVGLATAPLLFVLPILFEKKHPPGRSNNVEEIVKFKFFGDRDTNGTENCIKDRKSKGLNDDCTILYGPGKIADVFGWEYFDGVAFVIAFNDGYHMSIDDIAESFYVKNEPPNPDDSEDKIATIECKKVIVGGGEEALVPQSVTAGFECKDPKFKLKREKIILPIIDKTAAEIYPRVISPRGGDCKLLVDPLDGSLLPTYNYSWIGFPSSIGCNISTPTLAQIGVANSSTPTVVDNSSETYSANFFGGANSSQCNVTQAILASNVTLDNLYNTTRSTNGNNGTSVDDFTAYILSLNSTIKFGFGNDTFNHTNENVTFLEDFLIQRGLNVPDNMTDSSADCSDPKDSDYLGTAPFGQTLPASFYAGNSSITNNASSYVSPRNSSTDGSTGRAYVPVPPEAPFQLLDASNSVCFSYPSHNLCLPNGTFTGVFKNPGWNLGDVKTITGPNGAKVTFRARHSTDPSGTKSFERDPTSSTFAVNMTAKNEYDDFSTARDDVSLDTQQGTLEVFVPESNRVRAVCLFSDIDFKGQIRCMGIGSGALPSDFQNLTSSMNTYANATAYVFANRYGDASETKVVGPIRDLKGLLYGANGSLNDLLAAIWIF